MINHYTPEQVNWLKKNYHLVDSNNELTDKFNACFNTNRTNHQIGAKCRQDLKLIRTTAHQRFTNEQNEWLRANYPSAASYADLTDRFNIRFHSSKTPDQIRENCNKRLKLTGMVNITKYGSKKKEELPIGNIRKSSTGTYIKVKNIDNSVHISGYAKPYWLPLQQKIYEDAYGKIKDNEMICFLDGDSNNFDISNLYCINRKISAMMSTHKWWTKSREHTLTAIKLCELNLALQNTSNTKKEG